MSNPDVLTATGRLNWGVLEKLEPDTKLAVVRAWLESHQPGEPGYEGAENWLARRGAVSGLRQRQMAELEALPRGRFGRPRFRGLKLRNP